MSEIKGQLLGILLVIGVFGVVATTVSGIVESLNNSLIEQANEVVNETTKEVTVNYSYFLNLLP